MDKVEFFDEESKEYIELYVLEQTRLNGADYLLVTVDEEGDSDALILKDTSAQGERRCRIYGCRTGAGAECRCKDICRTVRRRS